MEPEFPHNKASGSGTSTGYSVQARYNYIEARMIAGQMFNERWKTVSFVHVAPPYNGVPINRYDTSGQMTNHGLMDYSAAQALRWWFITAASQEQIMGHLCLETRIIKHKVDYSFTITNVEPLEEIHGDDPAKDPAP